MTNREKAKFQMASWPSFWCNITQIWTCPKFHSENHYDLNFDENWVRTMKYRERTRFQMAPWPSFWPQMTHIWTWPRDHWNKLSDQVWWESGENYGLQRANKISKWRCDLVFDPTWPIFELGLKINETNILTKFDENQMKTMAYRERTRFQNGAVT